MKIRVLLGAWLLAIASGAAYALGLGEIMVNSRLNQPLNAEILVREAVPGEAEQLVAKLASQEDFARVGLERSRMPVMLRFETGTNSRGQTVIKVTSDEPVREPFLTLLVEANWSGGRLLREYGVLLDPPVSAPASTIARTAPPRAAVPAQPATSTPPPRVPTAPTPAETTPLVEQPAPAPAAVPPRPAAPPPPPRAVQPAPAPRASAPPPGFAPPVQPVTRPAAPPPSPAPAPAVTTPAPAPVVAAPADGSYTVQRGDTLYGIAREFASDAGVSADQMMVALQRGNANAFFNDNINNLKAGVVLRIPDTDSARSLDRSDAAAEVRRQNDTWSSASAAPTLADAGAAPTRTVTPTPPPASDARLELVPPKGDTAGVSTSAGRAGNEQGGSDVAEVQSELQRTREDLQSRDQEVSELGSRVRDLEELNAKNARLLELKNAEVAELQRRLAEAGTKDAAEATATTAPAEHTSVDATAQSVDASVDASAAPAATDEPANAVGESTTDDVVDGDATITEPATTAVDTSDTISSVGNETTGTAAAVPPAVAADPGSAGEEDVSEAEWEASATSAETDPFADTQDAAPATADTWAPGEPEVDDATAPPAQATTSVAAATTPVEPASVAQPWYMQPMVQGAGLIGLALLLLLVMLARRQRRSAPDADTPKRSVSDLFVDGGPAAATGIGGAATLAVVDDVESEDAMALQAQIERDPDDFGAYLELLSLYYAEGDRSRFELWAERFYDRPGSEESMEWEQVEGMGEELLPDHPLFGGEDDEDDIESDLIVEEESQVARPTWMDEPMKPIAPPVATRGEDTFVDDDDIVAQQPSTPVSDAAHLSADDTRRVYDIGGTDFTLDVGNDDLSDDEDSRPIEFSLDDLDGPAPARPSPVSRAGDADEGDEVLPPLVFGGDEAPSSSYRDEPSADRGFVSIDADYDSPGDDGGMDDAATKLELARAYLDMGDPEGARAMLEEVLGEGDTSQRDEARKLLATL